MKTRILFPAIKGTCFLFLLGVLLLAAGALLKVCYWRCPHCGSFLQWLGRGARCPHCGRKLR